METKSRKSVSKRKKETEHKQQDATERLFAYIKEGTSPYQVVQNSAKLLAEAGFQSLDFRGKWKLQKGKSYYTIPFGTTIFAFRVGGKVSEEPYFKMASAHSDHPGFRIKPVAEMTEKEYLKLDTESYGGVILNTWMDRPLAIAGKVCLRSDDVYAPDIIYMDTKRPVVTIPNLAIHMNRDVNKGVELNKQTEMNPLFGMKTEENAKTAEQQGNQKAEDHSGSEDFVKDFFKAYVARMLEVSKDEILDFDLYLYCAEGGCTIGVQDEFISSPRLDNLTSAEALVYGITQSSIHAKTADDIAVIAIYDNEEIGSRSKQGADSTLTNLFLEKLMNGLGYDHMAYQDAVLRSFLLSVDVSHCMHPNYAAKNDPVNLCYLNKGIVIKIDSTQKYASDTEAVSIVQQLCDKNSIPYQKFVNRSDGTSGSTLGSIQSSWLPMKTVDLGVPLLAMHSARELMGREDQKALEELMCAYFGA